jgi:hypothetical protein
MTDYERGYEQGKVDATKKMHPEIRKCLEDYFDKCFSSYREGLETYREGILVGPCFCRKWPGGVPPLRHWAGLTEEEIEPAADQSDHYSAFHHGVSFAEAKLKEKNT